MFGSKKQFEKKNIITALSFVISYSFLSFANAAENNKTIEELFMNSLVADAIYVDF